MNDDRIYKKIKDVAAQLHESDSTWTRSDLAYELKKFGVDKDSFHVSQLVWNTYNYYNQSLDVKNSFYNNSRTKLLINEYEFYNSLEENDNKKVFSQISCELNGTKNALNSLDSKINDALTLHSVGGQVGSLVNTVSGNSGAMNVRSEAKNLFSKYSKLVDSYGDARDEIKDVISYFAQIRENISQTYRKYCIALIDIFGDSIKSIDPEIFDYDAMKWLDVDDMFKKVELEYQTLSTKCSQLISEISESFTESVKSSSQLYKANNDKRVGLILATLNMASHYMNASEKTMSLKRDLLTLKSELRKDLTTIKGDTARLIVVYKNMNDLFIPMSEAFMKNSDLVMSNEINELIDSLYSSPKTRQIKENRDKIIKDYKDAENQILDSKLNIEYYSQHSSDCQELADSIENQYKSAKRSKPSKPFFLFNLFSFGAMGRSYNRSIYEWDINCSPVVTKYEDLKVDIQIDKEELLQHQKNLKIQSERAKKLKTDLDRETKLMMKEIKVSDDVKSKMINHLESMIALLKTAKEIIGLKMDDKLMKTVKVSDYKQLTLSDDTRQGIQTFTKSLKDKLTVDSSFSQKTIDKVDNYNRQTGNRKSLGENDLQNVTDAENKTIQKGIELFEDWIQLKEKIENDKISELHYKKELSRLQSEFQKNMKEIDDKSSLLRQTLIKINTSKNKNELKEALILLGNVDRKMLTDKDWNDFLNGNKVIEI